MVSTLGRSVILGLETGTSMERVGLIRPLDTQSAGQAHVTQIQQVTKPIKGQL
jgi:hypothetical protein